MKKAIKKAVLGAVGEVLGPQPSLAIVRFWQGVVEVVLRVAIMVSSSCDSITDVRMWGGGGEYYVWGLLRKEGT